jgi:hypothetical protein
MHASVLSESTYNQKMRLYLLINTITSHALKSTERTHQTDVCIRILRTEATLV